MNLTKNKLEQLNHLQSLDYIYYFLLVIKKVISVVGLKIGHTRKLFINIYSEQLDNRRLATITLYVYMYVYIFRYFEFN